MTPAAELVQLILEVDEDARDLLLLLVVDPDIGEAARRLGVTRRAALMRLMRIGRRAEARYGHGTMNAWRR